MKKIAEAGYNERLFGKGFRGKLHSARFKWLVKSILQLKCEYKTILELGCFDGKVIDYLPEKPIHYLGLDANWEGGLEIANDKWRHQSNYIFKQCESPEEMKTIDDKYDISICMETLEHVPPQMVGPYLKELANVTKEYVFITVPNEIGMVFFFKYIIKRIFGNSGNYTYTLREFLNESLGNTENVERNQHKGFNYKLLVSQISDHFEIIEVSGHPLSFMPARFNFGIGIIGKSKY